MAGDIEVRVAGRIADDPRAVAPYEGLFEVARASFEAECAWADVVVATCDDACPVIPGKRYLAWELPDPKGEPLERVREIRDDIDRRVRELAGDLA